MKIFERYISVVLSLVMVLLMSSSAFAVRDASKDKDFLKADLEKKLEVMAQKHGGKYEILDSDKVDTPLRFDSVEEFERALEVLDAQFETANKKAIIGFDEGITRGTDPQLKTFSTDHGLVLDNLKFGTIRQKLTADVYLNSLPNRFGTIYTHTTYIWGGTVGSWTWTVDASTHGKLDSNRHLWAKDIGHVTILVGIGGFAVDYTFDRTIYQEYGATEGD